ncbi:hypothetical protein EK599_11260 [Vibrio sp. T187]|uniref:tyrosine-type recombinase/integrase n=1 Tax=Vibrio TaxID=662 RepID=UPI0010C9EB65|nr:MULTISPECIES: tyrosine-type recombinase/integrase [Vibrio]MBW3696280.1 hypothetical protein [Vibrio sp. T187]
MRKNIPVLSDHHIIKDFVFRLSQSSDFELLHEFTQSQYSHNSLLAICSDWRQYLSFCHDHHINVLPASITAVRRFLELESAQRKYSSLKRYTATLSLVHTVLGLPNPINHRQIKFTLSQLQAKKAGDAKQTNAFTLKHLKELNGLLANSKSSKDIRDIAIYNVMFECVLKRSELKGLVFEDLEFDGISVSINIGRDKYQLSEDTSSFLNRWIELIALQTGPVFRSIDRHGNISNNVLNDSSIYRILRSASTLLDLPEHLKFSGQSLRVGAVKELSRQGMKVKEIQDYGRWLSPAMPAQYVGYRSTAESEFSRYKVIKPWD